MNALVIGGGLQGKAVVHDLSHSPLIEQITVVDIDLSSIRSFLKQGKYPKVKTLEANALEHNVLVRLIQDSQSHIVVCMLPADLSRPVAEACVEASVPFVNTSYAHWLEGLDKPAKKKGVLLLPEMGFDPGVDLILARIALDELDVVEGFYSYGGGIPELAACDNPLNYKITWTFDGVLKAYVRPARLLKKGRPVEIPGTEIFEEENVHTIEVPEVGRLEAYPNGDATHFIEIFNLNKSPDLKEMGRFATRWPGHCAFWRVMVKLGFLEDSPVQLEDECSISPRRFLVKFLEPRLQFKENERDIALLRIKVWGKKDRQYRTVIYDLIHYRDQKTGLFAMNCAVGFTASIGAQMILEGAISGSGVLSPITAVNGRRFLDELKRRGFRVERHVREGIPNAAPER